MRDLPCALLVPVTQSCQQERHLGRVQGGSSCELSLGGEGGVLGGRGRRGCSGPRGGGRRGWDPPSLSWSFRAGLSSRVGALRAGTVGGTPQNQRDLVQVPANHLAAGCPACALICNMGQSWHLPRWFVMGHKRQSRWKCPLHVSSRHLPRQDRLGPFTGEASRARRGPAPRPVILSLVPPGSQQRQTEGGHRAFVSLAKLPHSPP